MEYVLRLIANIAVSVFAITVGLKMWFTGQGTATILAFVIILMGISALESNITPILKRRYSNETGKAGRS